MASENAPQTQPIGCDLSALYRIADEPYLVLLIDQMTPPEQGWCSLALRENRHDPKYILAALRAREKLSRIPCYSHHPWSDLQGWVNLVTSHPVAYGLASPD